MIMLGDDLARERRGRHGLSKHGAARGNEVTVVVRGPVWARFTP